MTGGGDVNFLGGLYRCIGSVDVQSIWPRTLQHVKHWVRGETDWEPQMIL